VVVPGGSCEQVWKQIRAVVEAAGGTMDDLVKITTYIVDIDHVPNVLASRVRQFAPGEVPASALLVVKSLARPEFMVEIEAVALI
jgi:enamine deaminase RidA (YjgF/YER057c/UK114 family)